MIEQLPTTNKLTLTQVQFTTETDIEVIPIPIVIWQLQPSAAKHQDYQFSQLIFFEAVFSNPLQTDSVP